MKGRNVKKKKEKKSKPTRRGRGRPTLFKKEYLDLVYHLALLRATDQQIADALDVSVETINVWKRQKGDFLQGLKKGRELADANVGKSLYDRAVGYRHKAVKIMQYEGKVIQVPYTEVYPPETAAIKFYLTNRQPRLWRDKVSVAVEGGGLADRLRKARERTRKK